MDYTAPILNSTIRDNLLLNRILDGISDICLRHHKRLLVLSAIAAVLAIAGASLLTFDPDLLNLIPQKNKEVNDFKKVLLQMGTIDYHIVVLKIPTGQDASQYDSLIEGIGKRYEASPLIENVTYRIPNPFELVDKVLPRALLFLDAKDLNRVAMKLTDESIRESVSRSRSILQTPQAFAMKDLVRYDPFNLLPIFLDRFRSAGSGFKVDLSGGYYESVDHTTLLIIAKPRKAAQNLPFTRSIMLDAARIESEAVKEFKQQSPDVVLPEIRYTGGYAIAFDDSELIKSDIIANVLFSFFGVLLLFIYAFRRPASLIYAGIPMALGLALTFGVAGVVYGKLSSASAGFAALLAGLGIDFITVMYGRYVDERNRGAEMPDAIRTMVRTTLPGVFIAAITTAGTFYAFLATDFRGMTQLGFLTGTGIILFLLCIMFLLPALIVMTERGMRGRAPKLYLHSFGSERLVDYSVAQPGKVIVFWILFLAAAGAMATRVRFSDNIQDLRANDNRGIIMQQELTKKFGQSFDFMMYVVEGKNLETTLEKTYSAARDLDELVKQKKIASYQSITTFIPPEKQQREVIETLRQGQNGPFSFPRVSATFRDALAKNGFRPEVYDSYLDLFRQTLSPTSPVSLSNTGDETITKLTSRYLKKTPDGYMSVIFLYPATGVWQRELPPGLAVFAKQHPQDILTGVNLVSETLRNIIHADAVRSTILGFIAVLTLMALSFRKLITTLLSFVPFCAGAIAMFGFMALLKLEFNFMNIFVGLMIIGVATDYAIYMLQRYLENRESFPEAASETGKAVVMAALTAIVGYGSFAFSHYPGLRSIGYASTFGIFFSAMAAITLLPAILTLRKKPL
ncbi:MAG TPA: MMPL family transporter [Thermoanaerobaculia bacterium]|nr:MMPL family transporter [Thermoanaerobaculia bacterium]